MRTLVLDSSIPEIEALLSRRRKTGVDRRDEVWQGVLHLVPATDLNHARIAAQLQRLLDEPAGDAGLEVLMQEFNLGDSIDNYRIPDGGLFLPGTQGIWIHTVPMVIEVVSPGDESWEKLPYFASHEVAEVLIVDPGKRRIDWLALREDHYEPVERSDVIDFGLTELESLFAWP